MEAPRLTTAESTYIYNLLLVQGVCKDTMTEAERELLKACKSKMSRAMNSDNSDSDSAMIVVLENEKKIAQDLIKTLVKQQEASTAMIQNIIDNFHKDSLYRTSAILEAKDFINNKLF